MGRKKKLDLKKLYNEAYENANKDRKVAMVLLERVNKMLEDTADAESFASLGGVSARLMEKCGNSNRQIIKIAEILQNVENIKNEKDSSSLSDDEIEAIEEKLNEFNKE